MSIVLLLTHAGDPTGNQLAEAIAKRGTLVLRFDTSAFPTQITLDATLSDDGSWHGTLLCQQGQVALEEIQSVWYFHPGHYRVSSQLPEPYQSFAEGEARKGFGGILRSLKHCFWVSFPDAIKEASFKPVQLQMARQIGFQTPRTLVTNKPEAFLEFYEQCNREVITKALCVGFLPMGGDDYHAVYTSRVPPEMLTCAENVRHTATLFQEWVPKQLELRVTVIGKTVIPVAIYSQRSKQTSVDWRRNYGDLTYSSFVLSADIEQKCLRLVQALNLNYSCLDIIVTPQGEFVFLEANAVGQYLWLEQATSLPFTETLADLLIAGGTYATKRVDRSSLAEKACRED